MGSCYSSPRPLFCYILADTIALSFIGAVATIFIIVEIGLCCCAYSTYKNCAPNRLLIHYVKETKFKEKQLNDVIKDWGKSKKGKGESDEKSKKKDKTEGNDKKTDKKSSKDSESKKKSETIDFLFHYKDEAMVLVVILTLTYAACQFWDSFCINIEQDNCVEGLDCYMFPKDAPISFIARNWKMPPLNCSEVDSNIITDPILCYSYAFDIGAGISDAGGILAAATVEIITFCVLAELLKCPCCKQDQEKESNKRDQQCCSCKCCMDWILRFIMGLLTIVSVWMTAAPVVSTTQPKWLYLLTDVPKLVNPIVLSLQVCFLTMIPWKCCKTEDKQKDSQDKSAAVDSASASNSKQPQDNSESNPKTMI